MSTFLDLYIVQSIDSCNYNFSPLFQRNIILHNECFNTIHYRSIPPFNNPILWRSPRCRCLSFDSSIITKHLKLILCKLSTSIKSQTFQDFSYLTLFANYIVNLFQIMKTSDSSYVIGTNQVIKINMT